MAHCSTATASCTCRSSSRTMGRSVARTAADWLNWASHAVTSKLSASWTTPATALWSVNPRKVRYGRGARGRGLGATTPCSAANFRISRAWRASSVAARRHAWISSVGAPRSRRPRASSRNATTLAASPCAALAAQPPTPEMFFVERRTFRGGRPVQVRYSVPPHRMVMVPVWPMPASVLAVSANPLSPNPASNSRAISRHHSTSSNIGPPLLHHFAHVSKSSSPVASGSLPPPKATDTSRLTNGPEGQVQEIIPATANPPNEASASRVRSTTKHILKLKTNHSMVDSPARPSGRAAGCRRRNSWRSACSAS